MKEEISHISLSEIDRRLDVSKKGNVIFSELVSVIRSRGSSTYSAEEIDRPYRIDGTRLVIATSGEALYGVNLTDCRIAKGMMLYIAPGSVINPVEISEDFDVEGVLVNELPFGDLTAAVPECGEAAIPLTGAGFSRLEGMISLIWDSLSEGAGAETVKYLSAALLQEGFSLIRMAKADVAASKSSSRNLLEEFRHLLNRHFLEQRTLSFYADELCVSSGYLCALIPRLSGRSFRDWVNDALLQEAKIQLRSTKKTVTEISDYLSFATSSQFCRFFKRMTALSPKEYRASI